MTRGVSIGTLLGIWIPDVVAMQAGMIALLCDFEDDASQIWAAVFHRGAPRTKFTRIGAASIVPALP